MKKKTVLLIQPPLLHRDMDVDIIQKSYWQELRAKVSYMLGETIQEKKLSEYKHNFTGFIEPNIGLLYIAGALKHNGYEIRYLDFHSKDAEIRTNNSRPICENDIKQILDEIDIINDDILVGISPLTINVNWALTIAKEIKKINSKAHIVLGGVHVSFEYENILRDEKSIDYIIVHEGEESILELANLFYSDACKPEHLKNIKGLAYRSGENVCYTGDRELIKDLDALQYPSIDLLPKEYLNNCIIRVLTSRGCSNKCSFCVPSHFFKTIRFRDPIKVVDEIEFYRKNLGIISYMIGDLNFLSDYEYAKKFCTELKSRKLGVFWMCQSRIDLIDKEIVTLMRDAGCGMICLGIESADQVILNNSIKEITVEDAQRAMKIVKEAGIKLFTFWVFGLPGETHDSAHRTIKLLRSLLDESLVDYTHCTVLVPYPGTQIFDNPEKFKVKILSKDYNDYWMGCDYLGADLPVIETEELSHIEIYAYWQLALAVVAGNLNK